MHKLCMCLSMRLSVCKFTDVYMKVPRLIFSLFLPSPKEVLKCTEEVAHQMTLIDHGVYHMMSCDLHDDHSPLSLAQLCKISALELLQKVNMVPRPQSQRNSKMSSRSLQSSLSLSSLEQSETAIEKLAFRFNQVIFPSKSCDL